MSEARTGAPAAASSDVANDESPRLPDPLASAAAVEEEDGTPPVSSEGWRGRTVTVLAIAYSVFTLFAAGYGRLFNMDQMIVHLGLALLLVYVRHPVHARAPLWLDGVLGVAAMGVSIAALWHLYSGWADSSITMRLGSPTDTDILLGSLLCLVILEACRRVAGLILPVLVALLGAYALWGHLLPDALALRAYNWTSILNQMYMGNEGVFSLPLNASATTIAIFMVLTGFLLVSGAGQFFVDIALAAFGKVRGGAAKSSVVASGLFGMVTGSAIANTVTIGGFTIPLLKKNGYPPHVAAAIEGTASVGGQLAPPIMGAAAFIMADFLSTPYLKIAAAAVIPALLYYAALFFMVDAVATRDGVDRGGPADGPTVLQVLRDKGYLAAPLIVLVLVVIVLDRSIAQAGLWAVGATLIVAAFRAESRIGWRKFLQALAVGGINIISIAIITATVGMIVGLISLTGIGLTLTSAITGLAGDSLVMLLIIGAIAGLVLGTGLPTVPTYIVLAVVLAPALIQKGVPPLAAHLFIFYFGIVSDLTPPTALAPVTAAGIAGANPWKTMNQAFMFGGNGYLIPFMFALSPAFLLIGSTAEIVTALVVGLIETLALAGVVTGYMRGRRVSTAGRVALCAGALLLVAPQWEARVAGAVLVVLAWLLLAKPVGTVQAQAA